ncbi:MAG: hypothetical protein ACK4JY_12455 [Brevundimonas sp.]|uniref:hypothetical protein n=1 Tax=Brevundimonas sp. TaxID=1871086 RepID=UPI00391C38BB
MKRRRIGCLISFGVALILGAVFIWWFFFSEFMAIDRCLDAGGRWADGGYCESARAGG